DRIERRIAESPVPDRRSGLLEIMPFMVTIQGKSYVDRQDIQAEEFYKVLKEQQEIPKHSQITAIQFEDKYRELYAQGVRTIIVDVINGAGSQTCSNAQLAKQNVADELKDLTVYVVDSQNYTLAYGYPVIEACKKLEAGQSAESVVSYLEDWARHSEAFIVFDLRHMKKSGRITQPQAGRTHGLKPLIYLAAEKTVSARRAARRL
ncbi:MAG: DegV family protein, partial [Oscillospiraceae bacterium]